MLAERGLRIYGVDASATMMAAFRAKFPEAEAECSTVEASSLFDRPFQAIVAWGLLFLLPPATQRELIGKMGRALPSGGRLLMTAPWRIGSWLDAKTGRESVSLGREGYVRTLEATGFDLDGFRVDEGDTHYYLATKR